MISTMAPADEGTNFTRDWLLVRLVPSLPAVVSLGKPPRQRMMR